MTDRPAPPSGGGMTEATGSLTPDDSDAPFVPAELRAINRAEITHAATIGARQRNAAEHGPTDAPGSLDERPIDERPSAGVPASAQPGRATRLGGDEQHAPEDEHL